MTKINLDFSSFKIIERINKIVTDSAYRLVKKTAIREIEKSNANIQNNIKAGGRPSVALQELTIGIKGSSAPLIASGTLLNSIKIKKKSSGRSFSVGTGITGEEQYSDGTPVWIVARSMELGMTVTMSEGMRAVLDKFFRAVLNMPLPDSAKKVTVPARPFINPEIQDFVNRISNSVRKDIKKIKNKIKEKA